MCYLFVEFRSRFLLGRQNKRSFRVYSTNIGTTKKGLLTVPNRESHETRKVQIRSILLPSCGSWWDFFLFLLFLYLFLTDFDECKTTSIECHTNAACINTHGSYVCTCKPGYTGDGLNCTGTVNSLNNQYILFRCWNHCCQRNTKCTNSGSHVGECHPGYTGNGQNCTGQLDNFALR